MIELYSRTMSRSGQLPGQARRFAYRKLYCVHFADVFVISKAVVFGTKRKRNKNLIDYAV